MEKEIQKIKDGLKELLTADNTEQITSLDKELDKVLDESKQKDSEIKSLKDKVVDIVKSTSFKSATNPSDDDIAPEHKELDDVLMEELAKFENSKTKK